jgi:hypothetical protein
VSVPSRDDVNRGQGAAGRGGALPAERAFVLHLRDDTGGAAERLAGRVEHITSGQTRHFDSLEELVAFLREVVAQLVKPPQDQP